MIRVVIPGTGAVGLLHPAAADRRRDTGVLFVPPFGWDDVASYRPRRHWAVALAESGYAVLRYDLPGTGDSAGGPYDPDLVDTWIASVGAAADVLRAAAGCARVAVVGIGLGGLLAACALDRGAAFDDLVLWGAPARGKAFTREMRAFARMEAADDAPPAGRAAPTPTGGMEVGGFVLSPDSLAALDAIDVSALDLPAAGRRVLLLERDGLPPDAKLAAAFADVEIAPGPGYGAMTTPPHEARTPDEVVETVRGWLDRASATAAGAAPAPPSDAGLDLEVDGVAMHERVVVVERGGSQMRGILTEPVGARVELCVVMLNAGAIRRIGPSRMWVRLARRWAAKGVATLRVDLAGIGDSTGCDERYADERELYQAEFGADVRAILDALERAGLPGRFACLGLCSGAYWSLRTAADDERVVAAFLVNPRALIWDPALMVERDAQVLAGARRGGTWVKLVRGQLDPAAVRHYAGLLVRRVVTAPLRALRRVASQWRARRAGGDALDLLLDGLHESQTSVLLAFTGAEPVYAELGDGGHLTRMARWSNLRIELVGTDRETHTLRPVWLQRDVIELLDSGLDRELERAVVGPTAPS